MILTLGAFLLRTAAVSTITVFLLLLMKRRSAGVRHAVAASGLIAVLLLVMILIFTRGSVRILNRAPLFHTSVTMLPRYETKTALELIGVGQPAYAQTTGEVREWDLAVGFLDLIYVAGVAALIIRLMAGLFALGSRIRRAKPLRKELGNRILVDTSAPSPSTAWWSRSVILLPSEACVWPDELLEAVLQHERKHIERGDWWWNICGLIACTVAWPNPLAWYLHRRCRDLSEIAVDDAVLRSGVPASTYAKHLLLVASAVGPGREGLAPAMAAKPDISRRIETLMNQHQRRGAATLAAVLSIAGMQVGLLAVLLSWGIDIHLPFTMVLSPARAAIAATPTPNRFEVKETWYVIDADAAAGTTESEPVRNLNSAQLRDFLKKYHARIAKHATKTLKAATAVSHAQITSANVVAEGYIAMDTAEGPRYYKEATIISPGMVEFQLQDGNADSKAWTVQESTYSEGEGTDWVHRVSDSICVLSSPAGNRQLLVVHEFR